MVDKKVDAGIKGVRFSPYEFSWDWQVSQLLSRAAACSITEESDRPSLLRESKRPANPMIVFNGALVARNRAEVMDRLIGGYDNWQEVGRWGSGSVVFPRPLPKSGKARVNSGFSDVGGTSKGHALVRFDFQVDDVGSGERLAEGWMLLFLLGCGSEALGKLAPPRIAVPERQPDVVVPHETWLNVTFDWAVPSADWNTTHFETRSGNPAPLVHGPRNMALVLNDAARAFAGGAQEKVREITLGSMPAPHFPPEPTETRFWKEADGRILGRLVVPAAGRTDGGAGEKVVIDQIEIKLA